MYEYERRKCKQYDCVVLWMYLAECGKLLFRCYCSFYSLCARICMRRCVLTYSIEWVWHIFLVEDSINYYIPLVSEQMRWCICLMISNVWWHDDVYIAIHWTDSIKSKRKKHSIQPKIDAIIWLMNFSYLFIEQSIVVRMRSNGRK